MNGIKSGAMNVISGGTGKGKSVIDTMMHSDVIISIRHGFGDDAWEGRRVCIEKNRYTGECGVLPSETCDPAELDMLLKLYFYLKDDPKYKNAYDKLKFIYELSE